MDSDSDHKTPKRSVRNMAASIQQTPRGSVRKVDGASDQQTPRRSARKSIKPMQDYEDIVTRKSSRSAKKIEQQESLIEVEDNEKEMPKWTPAKVGRVSQKRKSRKSRKNMGKKEFDDDEQEIKIDMDVLEVIANDEDENKENVEPQEVLRNRKSPKDNENKRSSVGRIEETCVIMSAEKCKDVGEGKGVEGKEHILISLTPEEVKNREKKSPKLNKLNMEHQKQHFENEDLAELGLNPIGTDEPNLYETEFLAEKYNRDKKAEKLLEGEVEVENEVNVGEKLIEPSLSIVDTNVEPLNAELMQNNDADCVFLGETLNKEEVDTNFDANVFELSFQVLDKNDKILNNSPTHKEPKDVNTTFNTSDCVIVSPEVEVINTLVENELISLARNEQQVSSNDVLDDQERASIGGQTNSQFDSGKNPKILINDVSYVSCTPQKNTSTKPNFVAPNVTSYETPKQISKTKPYRFPTPYRSGVSKNTSFQFNSKDNSVVAKNEAEVNRSALPPVLIQLTSLEPTEIVLRSIRKRSLSVCNDRPLKKQFHKVTFNSPANQTVVIEDIDLLISQSAKKGVCHGQTNTLVSDTRNVTKRRKRSLSVDESLMLARLKGLQVPLTPNKSKSTPNKLLPPTKIPNFAAIHQRQFNKMENLLDHVTRKAERAKVLTTSASKLRGMSAQKHGSSSNNQNIGPPGCTLEGHNNATTNCARVGKPKALKKIDLSEISNKAPMLLAPKKTVKQNSQEEQEVEEQEEKGKRAPINLPNPRLTKKIVIVKPMPSVRKVQNVQAKKMNKPATQITQAKPAFNLSTTIKKQTVTSSSSSSSSVSSIKQAISVNSSRAGTQLLADKVDARRQRHMDMYKGRGGVKSSRDKDQTIVKIQGVRSNRRFDLQMEHRKHLNHDQI